MPTYRIQRYVVTDDIEVEAANPEEAKAIFSKAGVQMKTEFAHTVVEEVLDFPKEGYREETSFDLIRQAT